LGGKRRDELGEYFFSQFEKTSSKLVIRKDKLLRLPMKERVHKYTISKKDIQLGIFLNEKGNDL